MSLRVRPYFVNRLWMLCTASVGASFARDIGRTVASTARSYNRKNGANGREHSSLLQQKKRGERSRAQLAPTEEKKRLMPKALHTPTQGKHGLPLTGLILIVFPSRICLNLL